MATDINSSSTRSSGIIPNNDNSPRIRRKNLPSPWATIVRGESESSSSSSATMKDQSQVPDMPPSSPEISAVVAEVVPPDISDGGHGNGNAAANKSKKPAWNKPSSSNGAVVDATPAVMGAVSWPALSDSAKASPKSSSESLKTLADGSASTAQGPVIVAAPQKPVNSANPNSTPNHQFPIRQKSFKRGAGGSANGGGSSHQHPPPPPMLEMPHNNSTNAPGASPRDGSHKNNSNWDGAERTGMVSQSPRGNDHQQQRNSFRRGGHRGGDGSNNHYNHGNRRDPDRANQDSGPSHRVFNNGRDGHMQQRVNQRNFVRPMQPSTAPFVSPPPMRPFGNPMGFPDMGSPVYYVPTPPPESMRGVPFFHAAPFAMIVPPPDPLRTVLTKQIEYYFSPENLCKDIFLRKFMDEQGWVSLSLIAEFNRVKQLTNNVQFVVDCVRTSTIVEVQGDKIRKRNDWMNWTLLPTPSAPDPLSTGTSHDMLANRIQSVGLEEGNKANANGKSPADAHRHAVSSKSSSEDLNDQSKAFIGEGQDKLQY